VRSLSCAGLIAAITWGVIGLAGCGGGSPKGVAKAFVAAMRDGDSARAAGYWDYITYARQENPDWDNIATGQRNLIIKELQKKRAQELEYWQRYFPIGCKVSEIMVEGDSAIATIADGRANEVHLIKVDNGWYVNEVK